MGRGKIEIKKIENPTNRQVTFSKRRSGIMKKARELTVLCDAQVSIVMLSSTNKLSEYCSPSTNIKSVYDRYQEATNTDLWSAQYERMQNNLNNLKEINLNLRKEIRQRTGGDLDDMDIDELRGLEQNLETALKEVRGKKYHVISTQTETYKKKFKNAQETHRNLLHRLEEMKDEQPMCGFVGDGYEGPLALAHGGGGGGRVGEGAHSHMYAFCAPPDHQPNLHGVVMGYGAHDLSLG